MNEIFLVVFLIALISGIISTLVWVGMRRRAPPVEGEAPAPAVRGIPISGVPPVLTVLSFVTAAVFFVLLINTWHTPVEAEEVALIGQIQELRGEMQTLPPEIQKQLTAFKQEAVSAIAQRAEQSSTGPGSTTNTAIRIAGQNSATLEFQLERMTGFANAVLELAREDAELKTKLEAAIASSMVQAGETSKILTAGAGLKAQVEENTKTIEQIKTDASHTRQTVDWLAAPPDTRGARPSQLTGAGGK